MDKWNAVLTTLPKKFPRKGRKVFAQCLKKLKEQRFLKKLFFLKLFLWTSRIEFWHSLRNFFEKRPKISCSRSKIDTKIQKGCFPSYCPYGQVENSLDNIAENIPMKGQNYLALCPKIIWKFQFCRKKMFYAKCSYGDVEWSFDCTAENFLTKSQKPLSQCAIMNRKYTFFQKMYFIPNCSCGHVECSFQDPSENFSIKKAKKNLLSVPKR